MNHLFSLTLLMSFISSPVWAASGPFFSLHNTNFVVLVAFLLFTAVLIYLKVPGKVTSMLDARAEGIQKELSDARALREEAQSILASYERKQGEVAEQASKIIDTAKREAEDAATKAKEDLKASITRRLAAAEDQIASATAVAIREVRDSAISVAIAAAGDVISKGMSATDANALIDTAIDDVDQKLH